MRIAQFSDLHYSGRTLPEVERCFGFAIKHAIEAKVDAAVISGDSTDHELGLHSPAVEALAQRVKELADHCPVLMLQGTYSHEPPGTLNVFRLLSGKYPVCVADRIRQVALTDQGEWVESSGWRFETLPDAASVVFSCLPSVNKAEVAAAVGATVAAEAVGRAITDLLCGWGKVNRFARAAGIATVAVSHGTVMGCVTEHGVPMAGLDHEFTTSGLFSAEASAFMLGHIHKHQVWRDGNRLAAYAGSIGRLHYGEEDEKGFLIWTVYPDGARLDFVPTPARRMVHLDFTGLPEFAVIKVAASRAQGAFVRVRWNVAEEEQASVDRALIEAALKGAAEVKLEGRVIPLVRSRAEGITQVYALGEKVRRWAEISGLEPEGILGRLALIETSDVADIMRSISGEPDTRKREGTAGDGVPESQFQESVPAAIERPNREQIETASVSPSV